MAGFCDLTKYIITPLSILVLWLLHLINSINNQVYWFGLILLLGIGIILLISKQEETDLPSAYSSITENGDISTDWYELIKRAEYNYQARLRFYDHIKEIYKSLEEDQLISFEEKLLPPPKIGMLKQLLIKNRRFCLRIPWMRNYSQDLIFSSYLDRTLKTIEIIMEKQNG